MGDGQPPSLPVGPTHLKPIDQEGPSSWLCSGVQLSKLAMGTPSNLPIDPTALFFKNVMQEPSLHETKAERHKKKINGSHHSGPRFGRMAASQCCGCCDGTASFRRKMRDLLIKGEGNRPFLMLNDVK
jgi:hypothetical protein